MSENGVMQDPTPWDPDDAHADEQFQQMIEEIAQTAPLEPDEGLESFGPSLFTDESHRFWVGREFTVEDFAAWWQAQNLGAQPFNAVGFHHTESPNAAQWRGLPTLKGAHNWYFTNKGWKPWGNGPHLWVYGGNGPYRSGTPSRLCCRASPLRWGRHSWPQPALAAHRAHPQWGHLPLPGGAQAGQRAGARHRDGPPPHRQPTNSAPPRDGRGRQPGPTAGGHVPSGPEPRPPAQRVARAGRFKTPAWRRSSSGLRQNG